METITSIRAWEALDSRAHPTVGCQVELAGGAAGRSFVPAGASTGQFEEPDLRDGGDRYAGLGVRKAVDLINDELAPGLCGAKASELDNELNLPSNVTLALSQAALKARAAAAGLQTWQFLSQSDGTTPSLPTPMVNIFSGGRHAEGGLRVQDFLAVPTAASSLSEAVETVWRVRREAARLVEHRHGTLMSRLVADEGGLAITGADETEPLELLTAAIEAVGQPVGIAIDVAATQLDDPESFLEMLQDWVTRFPIVSVEDPVGDDDWDGWQAARAVLGDIQLVGDDLFATRAERVERAGAMAAANAVLIKPNQVGSIAKAYEAVTAARALGFAQIVSARSGDTEDDLIADLAVGWGTGQIKIGSLHRSERLAKYNRLLEIERCHSELGFSSWQDRVS